MFEQAKLRELGPKGNLKMAEVKSSPNSKANELSEKVEKGTAEVAARKKEKNNIFRRFPLLASTAFFVFVVVCGGLITNYVLGEKYFNFVVGGQKPFLPLFFFSWYSFNG